MSRHLPAVDVAMPVGERHVVLVHETTRLGPQDVAYLVGDRQGDGGAGVVHDEEGFVRLGPTRVD